MLGFAMVSWELLAKVMALQEQKEPPVTVHSVNCTPRQARRPRVRAFIKVVSHVRRIRWWMRATNGLEPRATSFR